jgi:NADH:ubiquinone oxidoreductase subunit 6 (subunit J)
MPPVSPQRQNYTRWLIAHQTVIAISLILFFGTFVWMTVTASHELNPATGQTHPLGLRATARYLTDAQIWTLKLEAALVVFAVFSNVVFTIRNRDRLG